MTATQPQQLVIANDFKRENRLLRGTALAARQEKQPRGMESRLGDDNVGLSGVPGTQESGQDAKARGKALGRSSAENLSRHKRLPHVPRKAWEGLS